MKSNRAINSNRAIRSNRATTPRPGTLPYRLAKYSVVMLCCVLAASATAKAQERIVVVDEFQGPAASGVRRVLVRLLSQESEITLIPQADVASASRDFGISDARDVDGIAALGDALGFHALIVGTTERVGRGISVRLVVHEGANGVARDTFEVRAPSLSALRRALSVQTRRDIVPVLMRCQSADEIVPEEIESPITQASPEETESLSSSANRPFVSAAASFAFFRRTFEYEDDLFRQLRGYDLPLGPAIQIGAEIFPFAKRSGIVARLGLELQGVFAFALSSVSPAGTEFPTSSLEWFTGLRMGLPFANHEIVLRSRVGGHRYRVNATEDDDPNLPNVRYRFVSLGTSLRFNLVAGLDLIGTFTWRWLLSAGNIESDAWFGRLDGAGVHGEFGIAYRIGSVVELQVAFHARRYFLTFNPEPGDPWIAGGALDRYRGARVGLQFHL